MLFLLHAGHMAGGAGIWAFLPAHADEVSRTVLEVHLEHAALEFIEKDGKIEATGLPEPRWWFTSRIPQLETAVLDAIQSERLTRSVILPSNIFGNAPPTDGAGFSLAGVPQVSFLTAPFYLFDAIDTVDKVDRDNLAPISRAAIRIIESTRDETAQSMRAAFKS
jgi:hypothetical protein